ncbi:MAG TPA: C25 family cysteine peptidase [Candidatus Thermoplasmatota archaeon]|nr:C25 family cysteine peptidase [Candidatus Thermoplasmatota archaeon]
MKNMKGKNRCNFFIQAVVALLLVSSVGVSAVHQTTLSTHSDGSIQTTFTRGDVPTITVTVTPEEVTVGTTHLAGHDFATIAIGDEGVTTTLGQAQLPVISRFLEIPLGAQPRLVIDSVDWETTSLAAYGLPSQVVPVQPSLVKLPGASVAFTMDPVYYALDSFVPSTFAQITSLGDIRAYSVAFLSISPVQYNPTTGGLRVMTHCTLHVELPGSDLVHTASMIDRYDTPSFDAVYNNLFANPGALRGDDQRTQRQEGYLIIVGDSLYDAIQPLADWKTSIGFDVTVTKTSEIPGGATKENIKEYIADAYYNWTVPPAYVLLVGDVNSIPTWIGTQTSTCTDLYYVTIDPGNYFADIIVSRFSGQTSDQITNMVDKTVFYEQGQFPDSSWIKKAAFMASNDNYQVSEGTHNYVIDTYMDPNNYTSDKLYCHTYHATTQQVTDALDDGRSLAVYSGHGSETSWADGPPFSETNVNALTNDGIYPFVCSHACLTNQFTVGECFGETWLRAPHKGGLAFWGATDYSYWDEDDILERNTFKAWWEDGIDTIGGMTNQGLYYLYQHYSGGGMTKYYFEEYNVLGDSSVKIWHGTPNTPPMIPETPVGPSTGQIGVKYSFTVSATDAENDDVYYMVSWGDEVSDWLGPSSSGVPVSFTHAWNVPGTYNITVKAKDSKGSESGWSQPALITILSLPAVNIGAITGGFGIIKADIQNVGGDDASDVAWAITVNGGFVLLGRNTTGDISTLSSGSHTMIQSDFVLGFGAVDILVTAGGVNKTATAFLLGPLFLKIR